MTDSSATAPAASRRTPVVELRHVDKSYGKVFALRDINLSLYEGEVVSLVGDNGAGKSTLTKLIAGFHSPSAGQIFIDGQPVTSWGPGRVRDVGIETVYQNRSLAEQQSVAANIFMGRELVNRLGFIKRRKQFDETERLMRTIGYTSKLWSPNSTVLKLSGGERQGVAMARALYFKGRLIMLDEPTTSMALSEVEEVLQFVRSLREDGRSILFVSHNIHDSHAVADRLVLLDRGTIMKEVRKEDVTVESLIADLHHIRTREHQ